MYVHFSWCVSRIQRTMKFTKVLFKGPLTLSKPFTLSLMDNYCPCFTQSQSSKFSINKILRSILFNYLPWFIDYYQGQKTRKFGSDQPLEYKVNKRYIVIYISGVNDPSLSLGNEKWRILLLQREREPKRNTDCVITFRLIFSLLLSLYL